MEEYNAIVLLFALIIILFFATANHSMYLGDNTHSINCNDTRCETAVIKFYETNVVTVSCDENKELKIIVTPVEE